MDTTIKHINFNSDWLLEEGNRLDGSFYLDKSRKTIIKIREKGIKTEPLENWIKAAYFPNRFKRIYVKEPRYGIKFLTTSDVLKYEYDDVKLLSKKTKNLNKYILEKNQILVSRSGTIGNVSLVYDDTEGLLGTEDLIRLIPKKGLPFGYIYAYLLSKVGSNLLISGSFGSVVDHIDPDHCKKLPIIILGKKKHEEIHNKILKVFNLRSQANKFIKDSLDLLYEQLKLPVLKKEKYYLLNSSIKSWEINDYDDWFRLDANFYNFSSKKAVEIIKSKDKKIVKKLKDKSVVSDIINPPRSSRIYVDSDVGIPYYSGANLSQFCKSGLKYLARIHKQINEVKVKRGWTLITRVGTTGVAYFVDDLKDGTCVSDNILRIIPSEDIIPEYLFLFLKSDYGKVQLHKIKTGSVQDYIPEEYVNDIWILIPNKKIQEKIAEKVKKAFQLRKRAEMIEEECKSYFNKIVLE